MTERSLNFMLCSKRGKCLKCLRMNVLGIYQEKYILVPYFYIISDEIRNEN